MQATYSTRRIFCICLAFLLHHQTSSPTEWARISNMTHIPLILLRKTQGRTEEKT